MVKLPNPPYLPDLSLFDFYCLLYCKPLSPDVDISLRALGSGIFQCLKGVPQKVYLSLFKPWILRQEAEFLSRENTLTS